MADFAKDSDSVIASSEYGSKLLLLAMTLEKQAQEELEASKLDCTPNMAGAISHIKLGKKYDKIDRGNSGKLMIERSTGKVYGIKAYGVIHKGHAYGTLDTIGEWYWGNYYPVKQLAVPGADGLGLGVSTE